MKQAYNPYLPSYEYVPDGEPHVFGDRIYLYGSHDRFDGALFCLNDYICWSASVHDLTDWHYEGVIYRKVQDPRNQNIPADAKPFPSMFGVAPRRKNSLDTPGMHALWAPDVVCGPDGRYYLYYCLDYLPEIGVAVCDKPAGSYEFLGFVRHADGTPLGLAEGDFEQFDPGIFRDTDGTYYLYSGHAPMFAQQPGEKLKSTVMTLQDDMTTLRTEPVKFMPDLRDSAGSGFEGHEFFEASSIRRIHGRYYFVYSSVRSHELCYAVSDRPDGGYRFGGTLVDIGNVFLDGRTEAQAVNPLGNTHGGIECCCGQWYVFYHRQTNRTNFSRQACAEKITIAEDGSIAQVEVTSCGLNAGPLAGEGTYPARICCHLTRNGTAVSSNPLSCGLTQPFCTQDADDLNPEDPEAAEDAQFPVQYICNMADGSCAGYRYFDLPGACRITLTLRACSYAPDAPLTEEMIGELARMMGSVERVKAQLPMIEARRTADYSIPPVGTFAVSVEPDGPVLGEIAGTPGENWQQFSADVVLPAGVRPLYFTWHGSGVVDLAEFRLEKA